jgi:type I restriction enzyme S subunit
MNFARLKGDTKGAIKGATLNRDSISNIFIPLPPLAEQHRIVAKIDELMALCDRLEAARAEREATRDKLTTASLARLSTPDSDTFHDDVQFSLDNLPALTARPDQIRQLRQTILNLGATGALTGIPSDTAADEMRELDSATDPNFPISYGVLKPGPQWPGGIKLIKSQHIRDWRVAEDIEELISPELDAQYKRTKIKGGEVLLNLVGASIGRSAVAPISLAGANVSRAVAVITAKKNVSARFIVLALSAVFTPERIGRLATGTAQPVLNLGQLRKVRIWLPSIAEQHRVVAKVDELMEVCDQLEASLTTGDDTRRRLLDALVAEALAPAETLERQAAE